MNQDREESTTEQVTNNASIVIDRALQRNDELLGELISLYERERKILNGINKRNNQIQTLIEEKEQLKQSLSRLQQSKAVKLQRSYWKFRKRFER